MSVAGKVPDPMALLSSEGAQPRRQVIKQDEFRGKHPRSWNWETQRLSQLQVNSVTEIALLAPSHCLSDPGGWASCQTYAPASAFTAEQRKAPLKGKL